MVFGEVPCRGKVRYETARAAAKALESMVRRDPKRGDSRPFACVECSGWHIGRRRRGIVVRPKQNRRI